MLIEAGYGIASNSMALLADAGHNLSDVLGLLVVWVAAVLSKRPPSSRYTYGLRSSSILAALSCFLPLAAIGWEAILRLFHPEPKGMTVIIIAAIGIVINGITALLFASGRKVRSQHSRRLSAHGPRDHVSPTLKVNDKSLAG